MAVEKPIGFIPEQEQAIEQMVEIDGSAFADDLAPNVEMMEDGSAIIGEQEQVITSSFDMNIAEVLDDDTLNLISSELRQAFEDDKASRKDWEETYKKGLDLLGFKYTERSQPFQGASSVTHPMLSEAITQFQALSDGAGQPPSVSLASRRCARRASPACVATAPAFSPTFVPPKAPHDVGRSAGEGDADFCTSCKRASSCLFAPGRRTMSCSGAKLARARG